jgi:hypothetical protein
VPLLLSHKDLVYVRRLIARVAVRFAVSHPTHLQHVRLSNVLNAGSRGGAGLETESGMRGNFVDKGSLCRSRRGNGRWNGMCHEPCIDGSLQTSSSAIIRDRVSAGKVNAAAAEGRMAR